jgi:hypothetical protein
MLENDENLGCNKDQVYSEIKKVYLKTNDIFEGTRKSRLLISIQILFSF